MKQKKVYILFTMITLAIISLFFSIYLTRFFTNQAKQEAAEAKKFAQAQEVARLKAIEENKTYSEKMNDQIEQGKFKARLDVPLIIQTDEPWRDAFYGEEGGNSLTNTLAINGCALTALAMVSSFIENKEISPIDILEWSGNRYFTEENGTAWHIFHDYALAKDYTWIDLEDKVDAAKKELQAGHAVIVSVKQGYFTEVGHVMVLTGYDPESNTFWINNPSDNEEKKHTSKAFTEEELTKEALRYWTIY